MGSIRQKLMEEAHHEAFRCVQCGYCLPVCPTYLSMGKESASPRGRIHLIRLAAEGKIDIAEHLAEPLDLCLGCRACETACPVGVPYGHLLESAKEAILKIEEEKKEGGWQEKGKQLALKKLFVHPKRLRGVGNLLWFYQLSGLKQFQRRLGVLKRLSAKLDAFDKALPPLEAPWKRTPRGKEYPAKGKTKARAAFFAGCVMDAVMHRVNRLSIELLREVGLEVIVPKRQFCCGALHAHQGMLEEAKRLARENIEAFEGTGADFYVNSAGGCGAMLKEYAKHLGNDDRWNGRAEKFVEKSKDISELLVLFGPPVFRKEVPVTLTYQDSCHLRNVQGVHRQPRELLRSIPGAVYRELEGSHLCCASGGIYNVLRYEESMEILDEKMEKVEGTGATVIVTSNPGCLLQMNIGVQRKDASNRLRSVHLVEVLAEACGIDI